MHCASAAASLCCPEELADGAREGLLSSLHAGTKAHAHLQGISGPQRFQIHKAYGASDRLPSAHTCFNQLDLLEYDSKDNLRDRLLLAMREGNQGFAFG